MVIAAYIIGFIIGIYLFNMFNFAREAFKDGCIVHSIYFILLGVFMSIVLTLEISLFR